MGERYRHLIAAILGRPWMIDETSEAWAAIQDVIELRSAGIRLEEAEIQARIDAAASSRGPRAGGATAGSVAVVPLYGLISPRSNLMTAMSGGTTAEGFVRNFKAAMADPDVSAILIDVDSPGGNVQGIEEAATVVREARGQGKAIAAIAQHNAHSAAYYVVSGVDEIVVTPSGRVGSIGVIGMHAEFSEAEKAAGITWTVIKAGKFKGEGNPHEPLSDDAKASMQADADAIYGQFVAAVAKGRGIPIAKVKSDYGQGRSMLAKAALAAGMVDRIDTFENTVRRLGAGQVKSIGLANVPAEPADDSDDANAGAVSVHEAVGGDGADSSLQSNGPADGGKPDDDTAAAEAVPTPPRARTRHDLELLEAAARAGLLHRI